MKEGNRVNFITEMELMLSLESVNQAREEAKQEILKIKLSQ